MSDEITIGAHPAGCWIEVWVVPGASRDEIVGPHGGALRVRVTAPPEGGKANDAVASLLKNRLAAGDVYLERGARSRRKRFVVAGVRPGRARLGLTGRSS